MTGSAVSEPPPNTDVLRAMSALAEDDRSWDTNSFYTGEGDAWQMASDPASGSATLTIDPALLSALFGPGVANTLTSARAVVELVAYDSDELSGGDVRVGLIGPGIDASHAYERTHIDSLVATTRLLLAWLLTP